MQDIRLSLEQLSSKILNLEQSNHDLKVEIIRLLAESKVERSDKLLSATEVKKKLGVNNDLVWAQIKRDPTFPKMVTHEGGHTKYSDKAIDEWIASKQIFKSY